MQTLDDDLTKGIVVVPNLVASYNKANGLLREGYYEEAIRLYDNACAELTKASSQTDSQNSIAAMLWNNRGIALQRSGRLQESVECYQRAMKLLPGHLSSMNNLELTQRHPLPSNQTDVQQFVNDAVAGSVVRCRVLIGEFQSTYQALMDGLQNTGLSASGAIDSIWHSLTSACPRCEYTVYGPNLGQLHVLASMGTDRTVIHGRDRAIRFIRDKLCSNPECVSPDVTLCWQP
ncbi:MAG: tetratricopeptide repeat protein [Chloroflexota bacterium]|nr:tetratricopeptide repeat protein [Chloroflexota bacterium]